MFFLTDNLNRSPDGGARRSRTDDILLAKQALYQLSYSPGSILGPKLAELVGRGRLELPTSRLSGVRSNRLSYRPRPVREAAGAAKQGCVRAKQPDEPIKARQGRQRYV